MKYQETTVKEHETTVKHQEATVKASRGYSTGKCVKCQQFFKRRFLHPPGQIITQIRYKYVQERQSEI